MQINLRKVDYPPDIIVTSHKNNRIWENNLNSIRIKMMMK